LRRRPRAFPSRLRCTVDQILGLLQTEVGQRAHLLDHLDLLVAGAGEDDVELVLLLLFATGGRSAASSRSRNGNRRRHGGLHVEGFLELLDELRQLEERHVLERLDVVVDRQLRHWLLLPNLF
jgi:hypothetical protein